MFQGRRDAAVLMALKLARLERGPARFIWTLEGRVRRLVVSGEPAYLRVRAQPRPRRRRASVPA